jgi:HEAT repeat protein
MFPNPDHSLPTGWSFSVVSQAASTGWAFDPVSFVIGLVVALLLVGLTYRYRARLVQFRNQIKEKAKQLRQRLTANMATRYSENAIENAQAMHLFGALASLDKIYVETRLYAPLAPPSDTSEDLSLSPLQAVQACNRLVFIGRPGSGRTTLLSHLLLLQANKARVSKESEPVPVYLYLPMLVAELADIAEIDAGDNETIPPAQRLAQIALGSMSRLVATGVARWLRRQIEAGNALILLDGWDEVPAIDRLAITAWIQKLSVTYPDNQLVVTAGERGYAPLVEAGFVPLRPVAWTERQLTALTQRWSEAWPFRNDNRDVLPPTIPYSLTPPTAIEATVELVIRLRGQIPAATPAGKMAQVLDLLLPAPEMDDRGHEAWPQVTGHRALGHLALIASENGRLTLAREEIQAAVTAAMPTPMFALAEEQQDETALNEPKAARALQERRTLQIVDCCRALTAPGAPIRSWDNQHYFFSHPLVAAYLAARHLAAQGIAVVTHVDDTAWFDILRFYVGIAPAGPLIRHLLTVPDDAFLNHLWTAAALLAASQREDAPWRSGLLTRLAQLFLNPRLPEPFRQRCLAALVDSGEAGMALLFKQAANSPVAALRAGAILGLGALGREQDLPLIENALGDASQEVRLAAIDALDMLARTGSGQALVLIITAMIELEDQSQRAAAEALAGLGREGHAVLRDASEDHDILVRRAAVYGLTTVGEPWAREIVVKMQTEDSEWLVRNAAAEALSTGAWGDTHAPPVKLTMPQAEAEPWLITWASEQGEGTGVGDAALSTLMRALSDGDSATRLLALDTLRRLGDPRTIDVLRQSLHGPDPAVRNAALMALDEISRRHDMTITMG